MKLYNQDLILGIQESKSRTIFLSVLLKFIDIIHPKGFMVDSFTCKYPSNSHNLFSFNFGSDGKFIFFAIPIILMIHFLHSLCSIYHNDCQ